MEPRRYLRCLGQPGLLGPSGNPIRVRTKKHLALLVYLAVESQRSHRRDRLAELLWPRGRISEARHSLSTALSVLRLRLGPGPLEASRDQVQLLPGCVALDLDRLAAGDILGSETTEGLEVAPFLDGFEIPDASEFALWKDRQQARLLPAIRDALVLLIDRCRRTGDSRRIEELADRMLGLDELSEEAIRAKMEARAFAGDRLTALQVFEEWRTKLGQELGAAPSDLVEGMAVRLRHRGWERTALPQIPTVRTDQWRGRPFVGRSTEYRGLYEAWEQARRGETAHRLILGDSGIGKTTLAERLTTAASLEGAVISRVQCYDLEREIPYSTIGSLILGLLDRPGVSATPPDALAELARTVPEVRRRFPSIPPSGESQGESARIRLTESFLEMIQTIADEQPVILVVDDLHLSDDASLAVLHLVMRRAAGRAIMFILLARPGELARSPNAARLRESGHALSIREIEVTPLGEEESCDLLAALVPPSEPKPNATIGRALIRAAAGFPMVLELLVQDWQANGDRSLALAVDAMTVELGAGGDMTGAYRHIAGRIIRSLDPTTLNVLNLASILGHRLNQFGMYSLIDLPLGQAMAGLGVLSSLRVLRDGASGLEFVNELVRACAYTEVPSSTRKALHAAVADWLLSNVPSGEPTADLEIAWHCMRAGRKEQAVPYLLRGARHAIDRGAPEIAERALSSALSNLPPSDTIDATLLLAEVLQEQGRWQDSLDCLAALEGGQRKERDQEVLILQTLAMCRLETQTTAELRRHLPALTGILRESPEARLRVRAGLVATHIIGNERDRVVAGRLLPLVGAIPLEGLDPDSIGKLALCKALLLYHTGNHSASFEQVNAGIRELERRGTANLSMVQLYHGRGTLNCQTGNYEESLRCFDLAFRMAVRLGNDTHIARVAGNTALSCGRLGRYAEQVRWADIALERTSSGFQRYVSIEGAYYRAFGLVFGGNLAEAVRCLASLDPLLDASTTPWVRQAWHFWKADILLLSHSRDEALRVAHRGLLASNFALLSRGIAGSFARWVALTGGIDGNLTRAQAIIKALVDTLGDHDALDQVEILCAHRLLSIQEGGVATELDGQIQERLSRLPPAVAAQLARLEVLPGRALSSPTRTPVQGTGRQA